MESLSTLQAKSVAMDEDSYEALAVRNAQVSIRRMRKNCITITNQIDYLIDSLPLTYDDLSHFNQDIIYLSSKIHPCVDECKRRRSDQSSSPVKTLGCEVLNYIPSLQTFIHDFIGRRRINNAQIEGILRKLKESFTTLLSQTIAGDASIITNAIRFPYGSICCKWSLLALWQLTQHDAYLCRIFVSNGIIIRRLLKLASSGVGQSAGNLMSRANQSAGKLAPNGVTNQLKASALRVLTYLCINESAMRQVFIEPEPGSNLITLLAFERSELVLKEAIGLLVQITTPMIDGRKMIPDKDGDNSATPPDGTTGQKGSTDGVLPDGTTSYQIKRSTDGCVEGLIKTDGSSDGDYKTVLPINLLVKTLTNIAKVIPTKDVFLLITASLANISFLEKEAFISNDTCSILISAVKQRSNFFHDIALLDQLATILANISSDHPLEIISSGGLVYLLSALEMTPSGSDAEDDADIKSAIERIQQKVAAAFARLASNRSCASLIHRLGGLERLVMLIREPPFRNFSETVLIASLAAVRRISATLGKAPLASLKALDLIETDLREVFVKYSTKAETYV